MEKSKILLWVIIGIIAVLAITSVALVICSPVHLISLWAGFSLGLALIRTLKCYKKSQNKQINQLRSELESAYEEALQEVTSTINTGEIKLSLPLDEISEEVQLEEKVEVIDEGSPVDVAVEVETPVKKKTRRKSTKTKAASPTTTTTKKRKQ